MTGELVPCEPLRPSPKLLGGSSKLAKLAEERRKKAAAPGTSPAPVNGALSSLDRLSKPKDMNENVPPQATSEPKKYPIRKKREPTPPSRGPTPPPPVEPEEEKPDLRASPTSFGRTISTSPAQNGSSILELKEVLGPRDNGNAFTGLSPDDAVLKAQQHSKGLTK